MQLPFANPTYHANPLLPTIAFRCPCMYNIVTCSLHPQLSTLFCHYSRFLCSLPSLLLFRYPTVVVCFPQRLVIYLICCGIGAWIPIGYAACHVGDLLQTCLRAIPARNRVLIGGLGTPDSACHQAFVGRLLTPSLPLPFCSSLCCATLDRLPTLPFMPALTFGLPADRVAVVVDVSAVPAFPGTTQCHHASGTQTLYDAHWDRLFVPLLETIRIPPRDSVDQLFLAHHLPPPFALPAVPYPFVRCRYPRQFYHLLPRMADAGEPAVVSTTRLQTFGRLPARFYAIPNDTHPMPRPVAT